VSGPVRITLTAVVVYTEEGWPAELVASIADATELDGTLTLADGITVPVRAVITGADAEPLG
jgi:hypothetical protein